MSLTKILVEISQELLRKLEAYGAELEAWHQTDDYEVLLYKDPNLSSITNGEVEYQIGFQRKGMSFANKEDLMGKQIPDNVSYSDLRKVEGIISEWLDQYETIGVGSNNMEKAKKYKRIFDRLGYNVTAKKLEQPYEGQILVYLER